MDNIMHFFPPSGFLIAKTYCCMCEADGAASEITYSGVLVLTASQMWLWTSNLRRTTDFDWFVLGDGRPGMLKIKERKSRRVSQAGDIWPTSAEVTHMLVILKMISLTSDLLVSLTHGWNWSPQSYGLISSDICHISPHLLIRIIWWADIFFF